MCHSPTQIGLTCPFFFTIDQFFCFSIIPIALAPAPALMPLSLTGPSSEGEPDDFSSSHVCEVDNRSRIFYFSFDNSGKVESTVWIPNISKNLGSKKRAEFLPGWDFQTIRRATLLWATHVLLKTVFWNFLSLSRRKCGSPCESALLGEQLYQSAFAYFHQSFLARLVFFLPIALQAYLFLHQIKNPISAFCDSEPLSNLFHKSVLLFRNRKDSVPHRR